MVVFCRDVDNMKQNSSIVLVFRGYEKFFVVRSFLTSVRLFDNDLSIWGGDGGVKNKDRWNRRAIDGASYCCCVIWFTLGNYIYESI